MRYIALLRGINVGGKNKVEMKRLKALFESLGYEQVSAYINSGNISFESRGKTEDISEKIGKGFRKEFGFDVPILVKTETEMKRISAAIPREWQNDTRERTDVAYLFPEIDTEKIIDELPVKKEFIDIRYARGAIFWNIQRENIYKSQLAKLISHKLYKQMTIRNVNTARYLAGE